MPITTIATRVNVNTSTLGDQSQPDAIVLENGNILVVWFDPTGVDESSAGSAIRGQVFSPGGDRIGSEFVVESSNAANLEFPEITGLSDGGFITVWKDTGADNQIFAQKYDASGAKAGAVLSLHAPPSGNDVLSIADVVGHDDGGFSVMWSEETGGFNPRQSYIATFDSAGGMTSAAQTINGDVNRVVNLATGFAVYSVESSEDLGGVFYRVNIYDDNGVYTGGLGEAQVFGSYYGGELSSLTALSNGTLLLRRTLYDYDFDREVSTTEVRVEIYSTEGVRLNILEDIPGRIVPIQDGFLVWFAQLATVNLYDNDGNLVEENVSVPEAFFSSRESSANSFGLSLDTMIVTDANGDGISLSIFSEFGDVVSGSFGADTLDGDAGDNGLFGLSGDDTLNGLGGDDRLNGGDGNDTLNGGAGNDWLIGAGGIDSFDGGEGIDTLDYSIFSAVISLRMDLGRAIIGASQTAEIFTNVETFRLGSANDSFIGDAGDSRVDAGAGNDILRGNGGADTLNGDAGNDIIYFDHLDTITGGAGYDRAYAIQGTQATQIDLGASGLEFVSGGSFVDIFDAQTATQAVKLFGNFGDDVLTGSAFDDYINGGQSDDVISGGAGKDVLDGSLGADEFYGGDDDDIFYIDSDDTVIEGGEGYDRIYVRGYSDGVNLVVGSTTGIEFAAGNNLDDIFDGSLSVTAVKLLGGAGNDTLMGGSAADQLYGFTGDDTLSGGDGNDILNAAQGADTLDGGAGDDIIYMDSDDISVIGGEGYDRVYANGYSGALTLDMTAAGVEFIYGSQAGDNFTAAGSLVSVKLVGGNGDDVLTGGESHDQIFAQNGNDTLTGGTGNDLLSGGAGADTFVFSANWGDDLVADFEDGVDILDLSALGITFADLTVANNASGQAIVSYDGNSFTLAGIDEAQIDAADFLF